MAPMQWPGTTDVLEELARVPDGTDPGGQALSAELPCRDDPELFFAESPEDVEFAKSLCGSCAARMVCLAGAIGRAEPWGVWGGELFLRGEIVPRKRPRGRPRKDAVAA
jgi:WhiB family transcriptional regulator, redox-sensing transcriptional regulator